MTHFTRRLFSLCLTLVLLFAFALPAFAQEDTADLSDPRFDGKTLEQIVDEFRAQHHLDEYNFSLSYHNTVTGESYAYNDTTLFGAASCFKLPLNLYLYQQELEENLDPQEKLFTGMTIEEARHLSIVNSDNDASDALLAYVGGVNNFRVLVRQAFFTMPEEEIAPHYYTNNVFCTRMMMDLLRFIYENQPAYSAILSDMIAACPGEYFRREVTECDVAHKYGSSGSAQNDVGIFFAEQPFFLAVLTSDAGGEVYVSAAARLLKDYTDYKTAIQKEADRQAAEAAEAERLAAEAAEAERLAAEQAEAERLAAEQAEAERLAAEQAEAQRLALQQAEAQRQAAAEAEAQRQAAAQAAADAAAQQARRQTRLLLLIAIPLAAVLLLALILILRLKLHKGKYER